MTQAVAPVQNEARRLQMTQKEKMATAAPVGTDAAHRGRVVVVMPAYNAARTLEQTVQAIPEGSANKIILVDDASSDTTVRVARALGLHVVVHSWNRGYGGNQKTCYQEALRDGADVVVMVHPDFQYDPRRVPDMAAPILAGRADAVIGSRFLNNDPRRGGMSWWRYYANRFLTNIQNLALGFRLSECHSGYRAYHRRVLQRIPFAENAEGFVFDSQVLAQLAAYGFRIVEIPIETRYGGNASSIGFWESARYGLGTLRTLIQFPMYQRRAAREKNTHSPT